jgi:antitoxin component YwqK of YwqJK toxin-antitoxin module
MEAAFMVQLGRFLSKFLVMAPVFFSCGSRGPEVVNASDNRLTSRAGILYRDTKTFTGEIFALNPGSGDTVQIMNYLNGKEHGTWKKFFGRGKIQEIRRFDHGKKTGMYAVWWENGGLKLKYHFNEDEYEGICREWNEKGILIREMNYAKGHEDGAQKTFYDNGKVRANYVIVNGRRYGLLGTKNCVNASDSVFKN